MGKRIRLLSIRKCYYAEDVPANTPASKKVKELSEYIISILEEPDLGLQDVDKVLNRVTDSIMNYSIVNNEGKQ